MMNDITITTTTTTTTTRNTEIAASLTKSRRFCKIYIKVLQQNHGAAMICLNYALVFLSSCLIFFLFGLVTLTA